MAVKAIGTKETQQAIDFWFGSTLVEDLIPPLADTIGEWSMDKADLQRLRLAQRNFSQADVVKLLTTQPAWLENPIIHVLVIHDQTQTLVELLDLVTSFTDFLSLVQTKESWELNVLNCSNGNGRLDLSRYRSKRLGEKETLTLLLERAQFNATGMHWAAFNNSNIKDILSVFDKSLTQRLLSIQGIKHRAVLSVTIYWHKEASFQSIVDCYAGNPSGLLELAEITDVEGNTAFHFAAGQKSPYFITALLKATFTPATRDKLKQILAMRNNTNDVKTLGAEGCQSHTDNSLIYDWALESLTNNRYLLFDLPSVIMMYNNTKNRPHAEQRANSLTGSFVKLGLHAKPSQNFTKALLFKAIDEWKASQNVQKGLIVALMSHGSEGCIGDIEGQNILLKDIEHRMCDGVNGNEAPKLLILQCCQKQTKAVETNNGAVSNNVPGEEIQTSSNVEDPASGNDKHPLAPSTAYSPCNANFCALVSTGPGRYSQRNVFIPTLAKAIDNAKTESSIASVMTLVNSEFPLAASATNQASGCLNFFRHELCLKTILPIYLRLKQEEEEQAKRERTSAAAAYEDDDE